MEVVMNVEQVSFHILPKIMMSREIFESLPQAYDFDAPCSILRKALIGARWYVIDPQQELDEQILFAHPVTIGTFVRED
jgi:hypothetical protein